MNINFYSHTYYICKGVKEMRIKMENSNALIGTAMLTAIWDQTHKDNLELLKPFIIYLVGKNNNIQDEIDITKIIQEMDKEFGFPNIPKAVIIKIFNRMKKMIIKKDKKFYLIKDLSEEVQKFDENKNQIQDESDKVINNLMEYLKECNKNFNKITIEETKKLLNIFLEKNGFITIDNIENLKNVGEYKTDQANYYIAKFIIEENENDTRIFNSIYKIVCGFMLANTIYIQVENDNKASLKNLKCYLDTPIILNLLELKTEEQNNSTKLLIELLEKKQAKIKCFEHNYKEVYSIIYAYKENLGKYRDKTLEGLDIKNYTQSDVERLLDNLENLLRKKHVEIEEKPSYEDYSTVIDEQGLEEFLKEKYKDKIEKKEKVLGPDIDSISAISRLRKGKYVTKLEESKAIFVTTNYDLIKYSNLFLNKNEFGEISYSISDIELTTILWLKTFKTNPDLPKFKLIENARLSLEPSNQIMERFKDVIEKMKEEKLINDIDVLENLKTNLYYKAELMEKIEGDSDNITNEVVRGIIDKQTENLQIQLDVAKEKITQLEHEKQLNEIKKKDARQIIEKECFEKASKISKWIGKVLKILIYVIFFIVIGYCSYITYIDIIIEKETISMSTIVLFLIAFIGLIDMSYSKMHFIIRILKKKQNNVQEYLYNKFLKTEKSKRKDLYN